MGPPNIKKMLTIKLKPRQDTYTDQFSRILMVKVLMVTATVTGISWLKDKVTCIVPKNHDTTKDFVSKACWINGLYVYRDLPASASSFYYGIPSDITKDGINTYGGTCSTRGVSHSPNEHCVELEKSFFVQYQWFPMGVVFLTALYYMPYLFFKFVNKDIENLKAAIKGKKVDDIKYEDLISKFFKNKGTNRALWRILCNILVKILYIVANVTGLIVIDSALNGMFLHYGMKWMKWMSLEHENMYDYTDQQNQKAGNTLLPSFALCQVRSEAQDIKTQYSNVHTYICEMSQFVLYQYILIVLWFMAVLGIVISVLGLIKHLIKIIWNDCVPIFEGPEISNLYLKLSVRERELMDYIKSKNLPVFGELLKRMSDDYNTIKKYRDSFDDEKQPILA